MTRPPKDLVPASTSSERILYQTKDGRTRIQCRSEGKLSIRQVERSALEVG
jgi:hypothetical protein